MKLNRTITEKEYEFLSKNKAIFYGKGGHWERETCAAWRKNKEKLNMKELLLLKEINKILKEVIGGFSLFSKFTSLEKETIRIEYNWSHNSNRTYFIGVGYVSLKELKEGFEN